MIDGAGFAGLIAQPCRCTDFIAPGFPRAPPIAFEQVGSSGQSVWYGRPDVFLAVPIQVLAIGQIAGGDELGMPHRSRPRPAQLGRSDPPGLQNLQRTDQLAAREFAAAFVCIGKGGERPDDVAQRTGLFHGSTIGRFHRPDGQHDVGTDTVFLLDQSQPARQLFLFLLTAGNGCFIDPAVKIHPELLPELRLIPGQFQNFRIWRIDALIGASKGRFGNPFSRCIG